MFIEIEPDEDKEPLSKTSLIIIGSLLYAAIILGIGTIVIKFINYVTN